MFGEILVGVVLGPTALNVLGWRIFGGTPGADASGLLPLVRDLAGLGVLLLMFVAGLETDLVQMRHVGKVAFWSAFGGVVVPFAAGAATASAFGERTGFTLALIAVAIVGKAVGCAGCARLWGFDAPQSIRVGIGMISRGEVGLIVAGYGLAAGLIGRDVFSAAVLVVLVTTMITPPLLRTVFAPGEPRPGLIEETIVGPPHEPQT